MPGQQQQSGFALLLFMIVMIGFITAGFSGLLTSSVKQQNEQAKIKTRQALLQAKEALLSYAVNYIADNNRPENMGALPCPDANVTMSTEGNQDTNCGLTGVNSIGLFPFKAVGLGKVEDSSGECLWYVVSGNYKNAPGYNLRNWDSSGGFINLVDENGNLQHGNSVDDFPVALIISPGASLNQNRASGVNSPDCHAKYDSLTNIYDRLAYLEGGPNLDYSSVPSTTDLPNIKDAIWTMMTSSIGAALDNVQYNDQVVAIYQNEIWQRVRKTKDLDTNNSTSNIRQLTEDLAQCLMKYGTDTDTSDGSLANTNFNLPFPANVNLTDYTDSSLYKDTNGFLYGRFPQDISISEGIEDIISEDTHFSRSAIGTSFCEKTNTDFNEDFWGNWKDHFFYVLANDFKPGSTSALSSRCTPSGTANCLSIHGKTVAAIVFFAQQASAGQDRTLAGLTTDQEIWNQYLDGINQSLYDGTNANNDFSETENDYAYCVVISGSTLGIEEC